MKGEILMGCRWILIVVFLLSAGGCATTGTGDTRDPFEGFNRGVYSFNQTMDNVLFNPVGDLYRAITPEFVDKGISNFFSNLNEIAVVANGLLQLKIDQALSDATRFIFNSTIGLLGFFDVSSHMDLPKHDEDFGQTLAAWGFSSGPYLVVPFFGPTTVRDATGFIVDRGVLSPLFYIDDTGLKAGLLTMNYIDFKSDLLTTRKLIGDAALDEYEFVKNAYFEKRASQIGGESAAPDFSE